MLVLEELRKLDPEMPVQQAVALLVIAGDEGLTQKKVAERIGMSKSSAQRIFDKLSDKGINGRPGLDVIRVEPGRMDRRETEAWLTPKGRRVIASLENIIGG
jgi:DNA-binding MarR family transcriptional regulator